MGKTEYGKTISVKHAQNIIIQTPRLMGAVLTRQNPRRQEMAELQTQKATREI